MLRPVFNKLLYSSAQINAVNFLLLGFLFLAHIFNYQYLSHLTTN